AFHEERDRWVLGEVVWRGKMLQIGQCQGRHRKLMFRAQVEGGAAGHENGERWTGFEQFFQQWRGMQEMLEAVQNQQRLLVGERVLDLRREAGYSLLPKLQGVSNRLDDQMRLADAREGHRPDPVAEGRVQAVSDLHGRPALADAAWSHQRLQPR